MPRQLQLPADRDPLRVMFVITSMPVGGAETLLVNLVRRMDRSRFTPELCCLKQFGPLGDVLANEIAAYTGFLAHKYDFAVLRRLTRLLVDCKTDAVVTVGTGGDKMFWGRLAAWRAGVPVVLSSLHSTGLPDHVELPNRLLTRITDGFIGVAPSHGKYLAAKEGCPANKVFVVPNGVDVDRFQPGAPSEALRRELGISPTAPVAAIVAALRPEKNHELFLRTADRVRRRSPDAQFLIVGDGPERLRLMAMRRELKLEANVHLLGTRNDIPQLLAASDVLVLTSRMEANPVCILEAMASGKPVVAPAVGSIPDTVQDGLTGFLAPAGDEETLAAKLALLLNEPLVATQMGAAGRRRVVQHFSLDVMVDGYQDLIEKIYVSKCPPRGVRPATEPAAPLAVLGGERA